MYIEVRIQWPKCITIINSDQNRKNNNMNHKNIVVYSQQPYYCVNNG